MHMQRRLFLGGIDLRRAHEIRSAKIGIEFGTLPTATERSYKLVYKFFITGGFCGMFLLPPLKPPPRQCPRPHHTPRPLHDQLH